MSTSQTHIEAASRTHPAYQEDPATSLPDASLSFTHDEIETLYRAICKAHRMHVKSFQSGSTLGIAMTKTAALKDKLSGLLDRLNGDE